MKKLVKPIIEDELIDNNISNIYQMDKVNCFSFKDEKNEKEKILAIEFNECIFNKIDMFNCVFTNCQFIDCIFTDCDLSNSTFDGCTFLRCEFKDSKLLGVNIVESLIQNVSFTGMLKYINIATTKFRTVEFNSCLLEESRFLENNFNEVKFTESNMSRIEFTKCKLKGIDFRTDDIDGIRVNPEDLKGIIIDNYQSLIIASLLGVIVC